MPRTLKFGDVEVNPDVRRLSDMVEVVYDKDWLNTISNKENIILYYMYRDLALDDADREIMRKEHLRYDITIIPPGMFGKEYIKTAGHYHPHVPGTEYSYTEVYQVLEGEATYLLQKEEDGKITDVMVYIVKEGGFVVIPPNYGHMTINASNEPLKMANWVSREFSSVYEPYMELHGAAYYLTEDGFVANPGYKDVPEDMAGGAYYLLEDGFIPNPAYDSLPEIRFMQSQDDSELGLFEGTDMYDLVNDLDKLKFLTTPQDYLHIFEKLIV